jgi:hypothetical protein
VGAQIQTALGTIGQATHDLRRNPPAEPTNVEAARRTPAFLGDREAKLARGRSRLFPEYRLRYLESKPNKNQVPPGTSAGKRASHRYLRYLSGVAVIRTPNLHQRKTTSEGRYQSPPTLWRRDNNETTT